ncbi:TTH-1 protein [Aphelenchoides avenae]|nr:TTH-1 protein [Aphelenchus avenae]
MASAGEPKSPTLEELPKISADLKQEVTKDHPLKHVEVNEKNVLPTEQDLKQEKEHERFKQDIESFPSKTLRQVSTEEKVVLPTPEDIAKEKAPQLAAGFDKSGLKHVEPEVKTGLPTPEEYAREHVKTLASKFDHGNLKHVEPTVKTNVEVISSEK